MDDSATLSGSAWDEFEDVIRRFEDAWQGRARPEILAYLPTGAGRTRLLTELVHVDLEYRLRAGEPARVEEYLARYPELADDRAVVLELIAAEHEFRRRREPGLALGEFLRRFPRVPRRTAGTDRPSDDRWPGRTAPSDGPAGGGPARGRRLRDPGAARPRRHGRRLPGPATRPRSHRGVEDGLDRVPGRPEGPGPLSRRGRGDRPLAASQHRPDLRRRRGRGPALLRLRVRGRRQPGPVPPGHAPAGASGGTARRDPGAGRPCRSCQRRDSPRSQAGQHPPEGRAGRGEGRVPGSLAPRPSPRVPRPQDHRLRPGQVRRRRRGGAGPSRSNGHGGVAGHAQLHGPRTGDGPPPAGWPGRGRLCPRGHPL